MEPFPFPLLLDGATGTQLMRLGMPAGVCTEAWVLEHPEALTAIQEAYVAAGAQVLTAPTFGANRAMLERHGVTADMADLNRRLVELSRQAAAGKALVAGNMAPTGETLRPFGSRTFEELVELYAGQAAALEHAGVDLYLIETMMTMAEARAAVLAVRQISSKPIFVTFTCDGNGRACSGTDVLAALIVMQGMGVAAFGLNCCEGPAVVLEQLRRLTPYASVPLIAKPSAGLPDVKAGKAFYRCPPEKFAACAPALAAAGVRVFGGCCGTTPDHLRALRAAVETVDFSGFAAPERDPDVIPCASEKEARFITPDVDVGEPLECTPDLLENILEAEEGRPQGALKIEILGEDDLEVFEANQYAVRDALCVWSDVPELLERALRVYQGRAFWDGTGDLEPDFLAEMSRKYGLVLL